MRLPYHEILNLFCDTLEHLPMVLVIQKIADGTLIDEEANTLDRFIGIISQPEYAHQVYFVLEIESHDLTLVEFSINVAKLFLVTRK